MKGKRTEDNKLSWEPGSYYKTDRTGVVVWYVVAPNEKSPGSLANHEVIEHEDCTITVSPSILLHPSGDHPGWHGYLEKGIWREC